MELSDKMVPRWLTICIVAVGIYEFAEKVLHLEVGSLSLFGVLAMLIIATSSYYQFIIGQRSFFGFVHWLGITVVAILFALAFYAINFAPVALAIAGITLYYEFNPVWFKFKVAEVSVPKRCRGWLIVPIISFLALVIICIDSTITFLSKFVPLIRH